MLNNEIQVSGNPALVHATPSEAAVLMALAEREEKERKYREQCKAALDHNKTALFDALATARITNITVYFDGYGDNGQIESVEAKQGDVVIAMPDVRLELWQADWESARNVRRSGAILEAVEEVCYPLLSQTHCGWENNEGAYGDFTFDVVRRSITLDYNERFIDSENHTHEF